MDGRTDRVAPLPAATAQGDPVAQALDGATGDYAVSGDAMRWSPELAGQSTGPGGKPGAVEVAAGIGSVLSLDAAGVRRLVSSALFSLTSAASDVVTELRQLTRGPADDDAPLERPVSEPPPR